MLDNTIVKINPVSMIETVQRIANIYEEFSGGIPFDFRFLDTNYKAMYDSELRVSKLSKVFAFIAIVISCLGLLGLTLFTVEKRGKEIGIRQLLGCSHWRIAGMLSLDFAKLVSIALVIGIPCSYLIATDWLANFHYAVELKVSFFVLCGFFLLIVSGLTTGIQVLRATARNPIEALRSE